ncbi:hypothetical protein [Variovorax boronicumulans]|uniref:hypothetical protein n=1 Tax=Variovorax boronicumulans TaxID=436515 RepID=UPI00247675B0|nr:hypothetical protein [Variovorax boronicumulans]
MKPMKPMKNMKPTEAMAAPADGWWPSELSNPSSAGGQNGVRYAFFPEQRRLVVEQNSKVRQYDSGNHRISGVSQQQQNAEGGAPTFASQDGPVHLATLKEIS